jgi:hypothetical protein
MHSPLHNSRSSMRSSVIPLGITHFTKLVAVASTTSRHSWAKHCATLKHVRAMQALIGDLSGQSRMQSAHQETHHFARADSAEPPKGPTWIHLVALHFSPLMVGQLPCRLVLSVSPFGVRLQGSTSIGILSTSLPGISAGTNLNPWCSEMILRGFCLHLSPLKGAAGGALLSKRDGSCEVQMSGKRTCRTAARHRGGASRLLLRVRTRTTLGRSPGSAPAGTLSRRPPPALSCAHHRHVRTARLSHKPWMLTVTAVLVVGR